MIKYVRNDISSFEEVTRKAWCGMNFIEILQASGFDSVREYRNLYDYFFRTPVQGMWAHYDSIWDAIADSFSPDFFGDTSISLEDFDSRYGFFFPRPSSDVTLDDLILLSEYVYNLLYRSTLMTSSLVSEFSNSFFEEMRLIERIMERAGYKREIGQDSGLTFFIEMDVAANQVSLIIDEPLSWEQLFYGHHLLEGNLDSKKQILLKLAAYLEPQRERLDKINGRLCSRIFGALNRLNIRHNNTESSSKNYNKQFDELDKEEQEQVYDTVYHLLLLGFLELEYAEGGAYIDSLLGRSRD